MPNRPTFDPNTPPTTDLHSGQPLGLNARWQVSRIISLYDADSWRDQTQVTWLADILSQSDRAPLFGEVHAAASREELDAELDLRRQCVRPGIRVCDGWCQRALPHDAEVFGRRTLCSDCLRRAKEEQASRTRRSRRR